MKIRLTVLLLVVTVMAMIVVAPAQASTIKKVINVTPKMQVILYVYDPIPLADKGSENASRIVGSSTGTWYARDAKCVVKFWEDPWHLIVDYKYTVHKHWEYNTTLNRVRNISCCPGCIFINRFLRATGAWAENVDPMDYFYTLPDGGRGHLSIRHGRFHSIMGVKGFSLPLGTWYVDVKFRVFSKNVPGTTRNWSCQVKQHYEYLN